MKPRNRTGLSQQQTLRLTSSLTTAIRVLQFDASGLTRYLEEQAAANAALVLSETASETMPARDWPWRWRRMWQGTGGGGAEVDAPAAGPSLMAHVTAAVARLFPRPADRRVAMVFVHALEPSGWLGRPLPMLAAEAGIGLAQADAILARLQEIEPVGLFARNLRECLELQARDARCLDGPMRVVLSQLDRLAAGDLDGIARRAGVNEAEVRLRLRKLRSFDPKPGTQFDPGVVSTREPDLLARPDAKGGWSLSLNRAALPSVEVVVGAGGDATAARQVASMIEARGAMLLRVGAEVLRRQSRVLTEGGTALVPMTMAQVAEALDVHESTVSRAVAGTSVDVPGGTIWLRSLFTRALGADGGVAAGALRARLSELVAAENPDEPLDDAELALRLAGERGVVIARRTVAKYRASLSIPPANRRRRM